MPCGNFGNITAAALAWRSGLGIEHLVAATNINKVVPDYLATGLFSPAVSVQTIASAMDVGNPGNFDRLRQLFENDFATIQSSVSGYWFDDDSIRQHITDVYGRSGYILDPHGAVASLGLDSYLAGHPGSSGIFVETAHPAKFSDIIEPLIGRPPEMPDNLKKFMTGEKCTVAMKSGYGFLAEFLTDRYSLR